MLTAATLRSVSFLQHASEDGLDRLVAQSVQRRFERGMFLFRVGEPADRIYVLRRGRVAAVVGSREGNRLTFHLAAEGECAGYSSMLDPLGHQASAQALTPVDAVVIPTTACLALVSAEPAVALDFARELSAIIRVLNESMADLVFLDLTRRLARALLDAPHQHGVISFPVSQTELAARLGSARQSLNQAFGRLAQRGFIRLDSPRTVRILDRDALRAYVDDLPTTVRIDGSAQDPQA